MPIAGPSPIAPLSLGKDDLGGDIGWSGPIPLRRTERGKWYSQSQKKERQTAVNEDESRKLSIHPK
jgi:hypothetical protein